MTSNFIQATAWDAMPTFLYKIGQKLFITNMKILPKNAAGKHLLVHHQ